MDAYYCLEDRGTSCLPRECKDVRCDECPNRDKIIPKKPAAEDAGFFESIRGILHTEARSRGDQVGHPSHYARWKMEPIEFIAINDLPWWLANVIKYTMRFDAKDGLQDLYKARSYLDMKIRTLEGHPRFWEKPVAEERKLNVS
jgi:hypothetical protein